MRHNRHGLQVGGLALYGPQVWRAVEQRIADEQEASKRPRGMAQKGEDGLIDMLVTLKCVEWQERVSEKLGEPLKPRSWTEWLRSWMPSWLPTF